VFVFCAATLLFSFAIFPMSNVNPDQSKDGFLIERTMILSKDADGSSQMSIWKKLSGNYSEENFLIEKLARTSQLYYLKNDADFKKNDLFGEIETKVSEKKLIEQDVCKVIDDFSKTIKTKYLYLKLKDEADNQKIVRIILFV
jgi:hypothetical protein